MCVLIYFTLIVFFYNERLMDNDFMNTILVTTKRCRSYEFYVSYIICVFDTLRLYNAFKANNLYFYHIMSMFIFIKFKYLSINETDYKFARGIYTLTFHCDDRLLFCMGLPYIHTDHRWIYTAALKQTIVYTDTICLTLFLYTDYNSCDACIFSRMYMRLFPFVQARGFFNFDYLRFFC